MYYRVSDKRNTLSHLISFRHFSILSFRLRLCLSVLSSRLHLGLSNDLFPSDIPSYLLCIITTPTCATIPSHITILYLSAQTGIAAFFDMWTGVPEGCERASKQPSSTFICKRVPVAPAGYDTMRIATKPEKLPLTDGADTCSASEVWEALRRQCKPLDFGHFSLELYKW